MFTRAAGSPPLVYTVQVVTNAVAVTLPVNSASRERIFPKMKLVKIFLRNSMTSERLNDIALLSIESLRTEKIRFR